MLHTTLNILLRTLYLFHQNTTMKTTITLFLLFISTICFSQEICDNAIDDDADGLIDLNDPDCTCHNQQKVTSIISNASFEEKTACPSDFSELFSCVNWIQATEATTDYINTCGFLYEGMAGTNLLPFPDGDGVVGAIVTDDWKEYLGTCLEKSPATNTNYQLTFNIAAISNTGEGRYCTKTSEPVNVTLYGNTSCKMPLPTTVSPNKIDESWEVLGSVNYKPEEKWETATINFTTKKNITSIMLGAPEILPTGYGFVDPTDCVVVLLFDNLILNKSSEFGVTITEAGSYCSENLILSATQNIAFSNAATYQWYKNGIAILGATKQNYSIHSAPSSFANYNVKITDGANCYISVNHTLSHGILDAPDISHIDIGCNNNNTTGTITVSTPAAGYSIDGGQTWGTSNTFTGLAEGTYSVKIKSTLGCESVAYDMSININNVTTPVTTDVTYCQYSTAQALTAGGTDILWYDTPDSVTPLKTPPIPSTLQVGTFNYYTTQTIHNCEGPKALLTVTVLGSPLPPVTDNAFVVYCQDDTTLPLVVNGTNLVWYTTPTAGNGSKVPPTISSSLPGTFTYYVSQKLNTCESERIKIEVLINPTPPVPEIEAYTSYKQYTPSLPLLVNGENIKWYSNNKELLNNPPVIVTDKLAYNTYYVSQTINDCESPLTPAVVEITHNYITIKYPIYFTPNGDGSHETWNIYTPEFGIKATVYIYDRYGKLITSLTAPGNGWDGKHNGSDLPATDYWFKAIYKQYDVTKEFKSHFSLIR